MAKNRAVSRLAIAGAFSFGCNAILGIEDRPLQSEGGGAVAGVAGSDASGSSNGGSAENTGGTGQTSAGSGTTPNEGGSGGSLPAEGGAAGAPNSAGAGGSTDAGAGGEDNGPSDCVDCTPVSLAALNGAAALSVKEPFLYYVDALDAANLTGPKGRLMAIPIPAGGAATPVTLGNAVDALNQLIADGSYVYAAQSNVARTALTGGTNFTELTGSPDYVKRIRTNSTHVFVHWQLSTEHITRLPKAGGTTNEAASSPLNDWVGFDVDETHAYFYTKTSVSRSPVTEIAATAVAAAGPGESFREIIVANASSLLIASDTRLASVAKGGTEIAELSPGAAYGITSDGQYAYFFRAKTNGGNNCTQGSELYAIPLSGGALRHLATEGAGCVLAPVQSTSGIYWLTGNRKAIHRAPK